MTSRYRSRNLMISTQPQYIRERRLNLINHWSTPNMSYPDEDELKNLDTIKHIWIEGDRYWKLASKFYDRPDLWWVIAWFNKKPTEGHIQGGDEILIPLPLSYILNYYKV